MRIALSEIWNFADIIQDEDGWQFSLFAGQSIATGFSKEVLYELRTDNNFNTELLPEIFTFREVLWQPNVFEKPADCLPSLRVLVAYCEEQVAVYLNSESDLDHIYGSLLSRILTCTKEAIGGIEKDQNVRGALGDLRVKIFPIIKFFVAHPRNRLDYYRDAVNRMDYAVKIMLTQFSGRYSELEEPFWEILYDKSLKGVTANTDSSSETGSKED